MKFAESSNGHPQYLPMFTLGLALLSLNCIFNAKQTIFVKPIDFYKINLVLGFLNNDMKCLFLL